MTTARSVPYAVATFTPESVPMPDEGRPEGLCEWNGCTDPEHLALRERVERAEAACDEAQTLMSRAQLDMESALAAEREKVKPVIKAVRAHHRPKPQRQGFTHGCQCGHGVAQCEELQALFAYDGTEPCDCESCLAYAAWLTSPEREAEHRRIAALADQPDQESADEYLDAVQEAQAMSERLADGMHHGANLAPPRGPVQPDLESE